MSLHKKTPRPAAAAGTLAVLLAAPFAFVGAAQAATITVTTGDVSQNTACHLIDAITAANTDAATGGCAAGNGADTIVIADGVTTTLTAVNNDLGAGANGLPVITSEVRIEANGNIIERSTAVGTPKFRLLHVSGDGALTVNRAVLRGGDSANSGGAILVAALGKLRLEASTVTGNTAFNLGGGISTAGNESGSANVDIEIRDSLLSNNTAVRGGGAYLRPTGPASRIAFSNVTVHGNFATNPGGGLWIYGASTASAVLEHVTVTDNRAGSALTSGSAGGLAASRVSMKNSLICGNRAIENVDFDSALRNPSPVISLGGNLVGCVFTDRTSLPSEFARLYTAAPSDLLLGIGSATPTPIGSILEVGSDRIPILKDNGGPTHTVALVAGSPAVNAGGSGATTTDQRGFAKAEGDTVRDIGAFEFNGVAPAPEVSSISPTSGPATGGTVVTVTGSNFLAGSTSVSFGGTTVAAANVAVSSSTSLSVVSPAGGGTVNVTVTTARGTSATGPQFTYNAKVDGACGSASGVPSSTAPSANLCASGTATAVSGNSTAWTWGCDGSNGGTSTAVDACSASYPKPSLTINASPLSIAIDGISTVTASSDNGLAPVLSNNTNVVCALGSSSDSANVSASATGTAAGTCTIAANQPAITTGTTRYQSADPKTVSITVNKKAQTITGLAASPGTIFVGGSSSVSATASSGLTVSFGTSPSSVCTNNGSMVTGVGAGTCTVTASQAGNDSFAAAPPVTTTITVNAVPVNGLCGSAKTTSPTATMPSGSTLCSAGVASPVTGSSGVWAWSCNGTNGGSSDTSCSAPYGTQSLSLSATPSSIRVGESASILASSSAGLTVSLATTSPACTLSGSAATGTNEGSCVVSASQPGTGDTGTTRYVAAASVNTTLTVNPAGSPPSACDHFTPGANVIDLRSSPGGHTVRGEASRFNVIYGSGFADTITGGNAGNCIDAGAGNDRLTAGNGENHLYGGAGNDTLTPGSGSTAMDGGPGTDKCLRASSRATATYASCESN